MSDSVPPLLLAIYLLGAALLPIVFRKRLRGADFFEQLFTAAIWPIVAVIFFGFCFAILLDKFSPLHDEKQEGEDGR